MRHVGRWIGGTAALYALLCRCCPGFARAALNGVSLPAMGALHRLTAPFPFPVAEPLAIGAAALMLMAAANAVVTRRARAVGGVARTIVGTAVLLTVLWAPALAQPFEAPGTPGAANLERLCARLIDALNVDPPVGIDVPACLRGAGAVAGMPGRAVKAARYPEWMRAIRCAGLFVPLTGEALADAGAPAALIPFTAVHELAHLRGVGNEGAANIMAWERCIAAGGAYAASARLWALRYAMGLLRDADPGRWRATGAKMEAALSRVFHESGGEIAPARPSPLGCLLGDYAALAGALANGA